LEDNRQNSLFQPVVFYVGAALLLLAALYCQLIAAEPSGTALWCAALLLLAAVGLLITPTVLATRYHIMKDFPLAMKDVSAQMTDVIAIRREYNRVQQALDGLDKAVQEKRIETIQTFQALQANLKTIIDRQFQSEKEIIEIRQAIGEARRRADEWEEAAIRQLSSLEGFLSLEGIDLQQRKRVEKIVGDFSRMLTPLGLIIIRPQAGDPFLDTLSEAKDIEFSPDAPPNTVVACVKWGFRHSSGYIEKAHVRITQLPIAPSPPSLEPDTSAAEDQAELSAQAEIAAELPQLESQLLAPPDSAATDAAAQPSAITEDEGTTANSEEQATAPIGSPKNHSAKKMFSRLIRLFR